MRSSDQAAYYHCQLNICYQSMFPSYSLKRREKLSEMQNLFLLCREHFLLEQNNSQRQAHICSDHHHYQYEREEQKWTSKYDFLYSSADICITSSHPMFSLQNYWCRHFVLSKHVLKKINQLCKSFFFFEKGEERFARGARVSLQAICFFKYEKGLGLQDILNWNQACVLKNIRSIFSKTSLIWIAWIEAYVLKGRSIWQISALQGNSRSRRKLLQLIHTAYQFIKQENGIKIWPFPGDCYSIAFVWNEIKLKQEKVE